MANEFEASEPGIGDKAQDAVDRMTGDTDTLLCGKASQTFCTAQKTFSAAAEELRGNVNKQPLTALLFAGAIGAAIGYFAKR